MSKVKTIWNVKDVDVIVKDVERLTGDKLGLEVKVNGRLSRALARCLTKVVNGKHIPTRLEFGNIILNVEDYEIFRQIVLHEIGHAIANKRFQDNCNHDSRFVKVCHEIGCYNTGAYCSTEYSNALQQAFNKIEQTKQPKATKPEKGFNVKYHVICRECGNIHPVGRKCDKTEHPTWYRCGKCGSSNLYTKQNW